MEGSIEAFILGVIQGWTEFLPVSSTAHLRIVPSLFHWNDPGTAFSAVLQLGTVVAIIVYFWKDLFKIYGSLISEIFTTGKVSSFDSKLGFWILLGTIPICIFGYLLREPVENGSVRNLYIVAGYLIFFGILLLFAEMIATQARTLDSINVLDALLIGVFQAFSLIPGVSRSGVTLLCGLMLGFKRSHAARFSFLLSVPALLLSGIFEFNMLILNIRSFNAEHSWGSLLIGMLSACISGYFAIDFLLKYLQTHKTYIFVAYRVLLGSLIIYLYYNHMIS